MAVRVFVFFFLCCISTAAFAQGTSGPGGTPASLIGIPTLGDLIVGGGGTQLQDSGVGPTKVYNITDYGAKCDGTTDDTAAINAAIAAAKASVTYFDLAVVKVVGPGKSAAGCVVTSVNATGFVRRSSAAVVLDSLPLICSGAGNICIDRTASIGVYLTNSSVIGSCSSPPKIGLQDAGATSLLQADQLHTDKVSIGGCYTFSALYNMGAEVINYGNSYFENRYSAASNAFSAVFDGDNHWNATSAYQTITLPVDTAISQTRVSLVGTALFNNGGGDPIWLANTSGYTFVNSYAFNGGSSARSITSVAVAGTGNAANDLLTLNDSCTVHTILKVSTVSGGGVTAATIQQPGSCTSIPSNPVSVSSSSGAGTGSTYNLVYKGYCIDLYDESQGSNTGLNIDMHCEQYTTSVILVTGSNANPSLPTLRYEDANPFATSSVIETDTGVSTVTSQGINIKIPRSNTNNIAMFSAANIWTISGQIYLPSIGYWSTAPSGLSGDLCLGSSCSYTPLAQNADSATLGGNARGANSVDWQRLRFQANQVASGSESTVAGGQNNLASGLNSTVGGGNTNTVTGTTSVIPGGALAFDRGRYGMFCHASGDINAAGDAQYCREMLRGTLSSTSAVRLTADGGAAGAANCMNLTAAGLLYSLTINIVAIDHTTPTESIIWNAWTGEIDRSTNAASTHIAMNTTPTPLTNGSVAGNSIAATADTTNACLNLSFTPPSGNSDSWDIVATVESTETQ